MDATPVNRLYRAGMVAHACWPEEAQRRLFGVVEVDESHRGAPGQGPAGATAAYGRCRRGFGIFERQGHVYTGSSRTAQAHPPVIRGRVDPTTSSTADGAALPPAWSTSAMRARPRQDHPRRRSPKAPALGFISSSIEGFWGLHARSRLSQVQGHACGSARDAPTPLSASASRAVRSAAT